MITQVLIRQENKKDYDQIFEIVAAAFGQENEAKLVNALRNNAEDFVPQLSLVATLNEKIVGHILFTRIKIIEENETETESLALAPLAVIPAHQRKGIGKLLINHGIDKARELQFKSVIVLGHAKYYPKFGFEAAEKWNIISPYNVPSNVFMAFELVNDGLKNVSGLVRYPKEFESL